MEGQGGSTHGAKGTDYEQWFWHESQQQLACITDTLSICIKRKLWTAKKSAFIKGTESFKLSLSPQCWGNHNRPPAVSVRVIQQDHRHVWKPSQESTLALMKKKWNRHGTNSTTCWLLPWWFNSTSANIVLPVSEMPKNWRSLTDLRIDNHSFDDVLKSAENDVCC